MPTVNAATKTGCELYAHNPLFNDTNSAYSPCFLKVSSFYDDRRTSN